jgi:DNA-binding MarR family transcriptional regulator
MADTDVAELSARLRVALVRTVRRLRRETDGELSTSMISALGTVERFGPMSLGELAEAEGVSRPSMTVLAETLRGKGLLSRETDPADRRLGRVKVTSAGSLALRRSRTRRNAYLSKRLRGLSETELRTLSDASALLQRLLDEE